MSDFKERLSEAYRPGAEHMRSLVASGRRVQSSCEDEREAWPLLAEHVRKETLPAWEERTGRMEERMQPLDLQNLQKAIRRLKALPRLTWRIPTALRVRALNFAYRSGIFTVRLLQLSVILAICYGIMRLIWFLA